MNCTHTLFSLFNEIKLFYNYNYKIVYYIYMCVWCVCMHMYIRTKIHNGGNYAHAHV